MKEYELKARLRADPAALRSRLAESGWRLIFRGEMRDRRLDTPERELERGDEVLRLRCYVPDRGEQWTVLAWKGPARTEDEVKLREELECRVADAAAMQEILVRLGYGEVTLAIDRRIEQYEKEKVTLRIEEYPRMDTLAELEGDPARIRARIEELGIPERDWKSWPLDEFVRRYERRTGDAACLAHADEAGV